jgi:hypothetical protein
MTTPEILLAATRYEKVRKLDPREYTLLWGDSLFTDTPFDELVDALPEPFRTFLKEEPKTCQTCKHWGEGDTVRIGDGKCEEIYKNIHIPNEVQWRKREWLLTKATFGCNGYERNFFGDGNL